MYNNKLKEQIESLLLLLSNCDNFESYRYGYIDGQRDVLEQAFSFKPEKMLNEKNEFVGYKGKAEFKTTYDKKDMDKLLIEKYQNRLIENEMNERQRSYESGSY